MDQFEISKNGTQDMGEWEGRLTGLCIILPAAPALGIDQSYISLGVSIKVQYLDYIHTVHAAITSLKQIEKQNTFGTLIVARYNLK